MDNQILNQNNESLQNILDTVNALPDASSGVELPTLTNPGTSADLLSGKQFIDQNGNIVTGEFSLDSELEIQGQLIADIQTALEDFDGGSGGSVGTCTIVVSGAYPSQYIYYTTIDENGSIIPTSGLGKDLLSFTAVCGTHVIFHGMYIGHTSSLGYIGTRGSYDLLWLIDVPSGSTVTVNLTQD